MPNPQNQSKSYTQRFNDLMNEVAQNGATKAEVQEIADVFIQKYKELLSHVNEKMAENKAEMSMETARIGKEVAELEKRVRGILDEKTGGLSQELDIRSNELRAEIGFVESLIENYDDTDLSAKIEEVRSMIPTIPTIPKAFDATEILTTIESLEKEIDALKKRPMGTVSGGVTDMRITQAFKNILRTEQPVGDIDGVNLSYTVSQPIFAVLAFSINKQVIAELPNYTVNGKTITFATALPSVYAGTDFEVKYI